MKNLAKFAGVPFANALRCATYTPACMVGIEDKVGSLAVGKQADILFAEDREGDIVTVGVMKNGKIVA